MPTDRADEGVSLSDIAARIGARLEGNPAARAYGLCSLEEPLAGCLAFARYSSVNRILRYDLAPLGALILTDKVAADARLKKVNLLRTADPLRALVDLVPLFFQPYPVNRDISPRADVDPAAKIGKNVSIGAFCSIAAGVEIGDNTTIYPQVTIYPGAKIGADSVIHAGVVIREDCILGRKSVIQPGAIVGADGFGYMPDPQGGLIGVPQIGTVVLGDQVELGANACVDRATLGTTQIGKGTKLDNLVQIGHNTHIGQHCIVCGQAAIGGSCSIGNQVVVGGNTGIADHCIIAEGCRIAGHSGVTGVLAEKADYAGFPLVEARTWRRQFALLSSMSKNMRISKSVLKPREDQCD